MNVLRLLKTPCTITTPAVEVDEYGDETPTGTPSVVSTVCWAFPNASSEDTANGTTEEGTWSVYLPGDTVLEATSIVTPAGGPELAVQGPPRPFRNPRTQGVAYVLVDAKVVE